MKAVISGLLSHYGMDSPSSQGSPGYYSGTDSYPETESVVQDVQYPQSYHYNNTEYNQTPYNYSSDDWRYYNHSAYYNNVYNETNYSYDQTAYQHQHTYQPGVNGNGYSAMNGYSAVDCAYASQNCYVPSSHPSFTSEENSLEGCHWDGVS